MSGPHVEDPSLTPPRYTEETINLVASHMPMLGSWHRCAEARAVLDALADAGLLLPPGDQPRGGESARPYGTIDAAGMLFQHPTAPAAWPPEQWVNLGPAGETDLP